MATTIKIKPARQEIRLDDSPDSPVYVLDLTDSSASALIGKMRRHFAAYERLQKALASGEDVGAELARVYKLVITDTLGKKAYEDALSLARNGADIPAEELGLALSPLALWLFQQVSDAVTANDNEAVRRYLGTR